MQLTDPTPAQDALTPFVFEHTAIRSVEVGLSQSPDGFQAGEHIAQHLPASIAGTDGAAQKLAHVLVLTDGLNVNGSDFVAGLMKHVPEGIAVTGGDSTPGTNLPP